jgi:serine/threonine-protein kinase
VDLKEATSRLANKGLNLGAVQEIFDEKYDTGIVISQKPAADASANAGTKVDVVVSKGKSPGKITMPDLRGLSLTSATKRLEDNKLVLGDVKRQDSTNYFEDQVSAQDTSPGVLVDEGTKVNLTISTGPGPTAKTKRLQFTLPTQQQSYKVVVKVKDVQGEREVYNAQHRAGESVSVTVTYFGSGTATVTLNGSSFKTFNL